MSWHDDCSTINKWLVEYITEGRSLVSDGQSIYVSLGDITEEEGYVSLNIIHNVPISGDFEIVANVTIPEFTMAEEYTFFSLDFYINFDNYIKNDDGTKSRRYLDFYFTKSGLDDNGIYLYGFQTSDQAIVLTLPWTGDLKVTRVGNAVNVYIGEVLLWSGTNEVNSVAKGKNLEFYFESDGNETYPLALPQFKVNDVSITGTTTSSDASLYSLSCDSAILDPEFYTTTYEYTGDIPYTCEEVKFLLQNTEGEATITINSIEVESNVLSDGFSVETGDNEFTIHVVAEDGVTTKDYIVTLTKAVGPSTVCTLNNLSGDPEISPVFDKEVFSYSVSFDALRTSFSFTPIKTHSLSTLTWDGNIIESGEEQTITDLPEGFTLIDIVVTAEDRETTNTYSITVERVVPPGNADLSNLYAAELHDIYGFFFNPIFNKDITHYYLKIINTSTINVYATTMYASSTMKINGLDVLSGQGFEVSLEENQNIITIDIKSADETITKTYILEVWNFVLEIDGFTDILGIWDYYTNNLWHTDIPFHSENTILYIDSFEFDKPFSNVICPFINRLTSLVEEDWCSMTIEVNIPDFDCSFPGSIYNGASFGPYIDLRTLRTEHAYEEYDIKPGPGNFKVIEGVNYLQWLSTLDNINVTIYNLPLPFSGSLGVSINGDIISYFVNGEVIGQDLITNYVGDGVLKGYFPGGFLFKTTDNGTYDSEIPEIQLSNFVFVGKVTTKIYLKCIGALVDTKAGGLINIIKKGVL